MPLISTPAIVLQSYPYSETSKILRLLTPAHGVCSVIAKGAQRPRSRFGGLLETFTEGRAEIYFKEGRELHILTAFDLARSRQALGNDLAAFAGGSLLAELVLRFGTTEAQPELFRLFASALDRLTGANSDSVLEIVVADGWRIVCNLGYRPQTDQCVSCGKDVSEESEVRFDVEAGGVTCKRCRPAGRPLNTRSLAELRAMIAGEPLRQRFSDPSLQRALLRAFLTSHLAREHALRSLPLFLEQVR